MDPVVIAACISAAGVLLQVLVGLVFQILNARTAKRMVEAQNKSALAATGQAALERQRRADATESELGELIQLVSEAARKSPRDVDLRVLLGVLFRDEQSPPSIDLATANLARVAWCQLLDWYERHLGFARALPSDVSSQLSCFHRVCRTPARDDPPFETCPCTHQSLQTLQANLMEVDLFSSFGG